jgi:glutathione synthase/RimK-type ligase-like ATP-grasp enzyme
MGRTDVIVAVVAGNKHARSTRRRIEVSGEWRGNSNNGRYQARLFVRWRDIESEVNIGSKKKSSYFCAV